MADEHPAPWRWDDGHAWHEHERAGGGTVVDYFGELKDGNGETLLCATYDDSSIHVTSARVHALIVAAPEMEALLRRIHAHHLRSASIHGDEIEALLAHIDAASK